MKINGKELTRAMREKLASLDGRGMPTLTGHKATLQALVRCGFAEDFGFIVTLSPEGARARREIIKRAEDKLRELGWVSYEAVGGVGATTHWRPPSPAPGWKGCTLMLAMARAGIHY